jgi:hypothetical protein
MLAHSLIQAGAELRAINGRRSGGVEHGKKIAGPLILFFNIVK